MSNHRITHIAAVALAIAAAAAPAAAARPADGTTDWKLPHDFQTADSRDAGPDAQPPQDLRHPDTVDFANGRGTYNAPEVVVVDAPEPVATPSARGIDWADVGLGAGGLLGLALIAAGGGLVVVHRRSTGRFAG